MSRPGRPPVLNKIVKAKILFLLSAGSSRQMAASCVGCHPQTIRNTALRDPQFALDLMRQETALENQLLRNIANAGKDPRHWRALAWYLERTDREQLGAGTPNVLTWKEFSGFMSIITEMLLEVPITKHPKRLLARIDSMFAEMPGALKCRRGKYSCSKTLKSSKKSRDRSLPIPENRRIPLVQPEGSIPD